MPYRLFVSFTEEDKPIANAIETSINNAFQGSVTTFFSSIHLNAGDDWQQSIKRALSDSDAVLSVISHKSIRKPWIFIEWSAFWMNDKDSFVCLTDSSLADGLVQPMQNRQYILATNIDQVRSLFRAISTNAKLSRVPYAHVDNWIAEIEKALGEQRRSEFDFVLEDLSRLPTADEEKMAIARHALESGQMDQLHDVLERVRSDYLKNNLIHNLIDEGKIGLIETIFDSIRGAQNQTEILTHLVDSSYEDVRIYESMIASIARKDQTQMLNLAGHLIEQDRTSGELFRMVVAHTTNMAELRKIAIQLFDRFGPEEETLGQIVQTLSQNNRVELRKLGEYAYFSRQQSAPFVDDVIELLRKTNNIQYELIINKIKDNNTN